MASPLPGDLTMQLIGGAMVALGAYVCFGNVFHFFPTSSLVGYGTMVVGGMLMKSGGRSSHS